MRFLENAAIRSHLSRLNTLAVILVIAIIYVAIGRLSLLLALPPGLTTAIFPPAGIALGTAYVLGRRALPGTFLGSLLLNIWIGHSPNPALYAPELFATLIAVSSTLQAAVGGWLLQRELGDQSAFDRPRDVATFLLLAPLICLISSSVAVSSLAVVGVFNRANAITNWLTWILGDTMGVLVVMPILMALIGQPQSLWRKRRLVIIAPMLIAVALLLLLFIQASHWEELESLNFLRTQVGWQSWTVLTLGLFGTGLLGAFLMLSSGHAALVEIEVERHVQALREQTEKLRMSEDRWQFALESAGDGAWDFNIETGEMFLSRQNMVMLGYPNEACRMHVDEWIRRIHPDDIEPSQLLVRKYLNGELPNYILDFRIQTREGRYRWLRARGKILSWSADGKPTRLIGTHADIDTAKHLEYRERLHGSVMETLARGGELLEVLAKIAASLQEIDRDLTYAVFTAHQAHLSIRVGDRLMDNVRARQIPLGDNPQSGGRAILAGGIIDKPVSDKVLWQRLIELAGESGLILSWVEIIASNASVVEGALVAFKCKAESNALPDLDHIKHAASLMAIAIQRYRITEQVQLANSVYEACSEGIIVTDGDNYVLSVNPAFSQIMGYTAEEIIGKTTDKFRVDELSAKAYTEIGVAEDQSRYWQGELWAQRKDGSIFPISATLNSIYDESGHAVMRVCVFSDITDKKKAERRMQYLASHDPLTALPNRVLFKDRLQRALATANRDNNLLALLYIDLDYFKPVNDNLGHRIGDQVLAAVASRMQECMRESDTVARLGGDEFVVLLPEINANSDAFLVAEKIRQSLCEPFHIEEHSINISASIGVAIYPEHGSNEEELSTHADRAMYDAKHQGRNTVSS